MKVGQTYTFVVQAIKYRRLDCRIAMRTDVPIPLVISDNKNNIRALWTI